MPAADAGYFFLPAFSVDADASNAAGSLGVCNIENPTYYDGANVDNNNTTSTTKAASVYNRVYQYAVTLDTSMF